MVSTISLKYQHKQNKNIQLKDISSVELPIHKQIFKDEIKDKILLICKNQKQYIQKLMYNLLEKTEENVSIICDYII